LAKLRRLRYESFVLHPPEKTKTSSDEDESTGEIEEENNNYLKSKNHNNKSIENSTTTTPPLEEDKLAVPSRDQTNKTPVKTNRIRLSSTSSSSSKKRHFDNNSDVKNEFQLSDVIPYINQGIEAIIDDNVTKRFTTKELTVWNLLSRTNQQYEYISFRVTLLWALGLILRYSVLFPFRLILFIFACMYTFLSSVIIGTIPDGRFKRWLNWYQTLILHRILSRVFSAIITFHNRENRARTGSICVANHTSPIDVIILSTDACYAMIGQTHGGFTGMMQRAFSRSANHIWFDRTQTRDRNYVAKRMRQHVSHPDNLPILIFPEGTCINNTSVMMFKKGCFEVDTTIYPVAIKYDLRFGDAFWNSGKHSMLQYLLLMMTSWAIVVDVYYLPPMSREVGFFFLIFF
jgi:glycerol-3-phosphate O-acyltransferase 3/4